MDVAAVYSFVGNIAGAYILLTLCYGLLYSVKSPEVKIEFAFLGISAIKWLYAGGFSILVKLYLAWPFRCCKSSKFQSFTAEV